MWIPITLAAATFQILRTSRQHQLGSVLSTNGAGFVRYLYGAPLALILTAISFGVLGRAVPEIPPRFWIVITVAGMAQILGTLALLRSFALRDFALGTVYAKTEVIQVAIIGAVVLAEPLQPVGWGGALICTVGVAWLAGRGSLSTLIQRAGDPAALMGIAAGGLFGAAAVGIRAASGSLGQAPAWDRAVLTLTVMLVIQTLVNGAYLASRDRGQITQVVRHWRLAVPVGILSLAGSTGWALAVTLENAAKVRTLGQVELVIAFAISHRRLGERHTAKEFMATALVLIGILAVAVWG
jgi:drug/metabolite transporter (DMT)-like permease